MRTKQDVLDDLHYAENVLHDEVKIRELLEELDEFERDSTAYLGDRED